MNPDPPPRRAALVLVTPTGEPIGRLPEVPVATRWWPDVQSIVQAARERYGIEVVILRMLDSELPRPHGGGVTYLAEVSTPIARSPLAAEALQPFDVTLDEQPLRLRWAKPGGPDADLAWAEEVLRRAGSSATGRRSRCAAGTCPASGGCRSRAAAPRGSRSCRRSSPTRATCSAVSRATPVPRLLGHEGDRGPARRRAGRRPVRRGRARAARDGDDAGRPPGGLDRARRRPPAHRAARLARAGAHGPHRRRRPTPFRGAHRR